MFQSASHRLSGIIAFWIAGVVMFCVHDARIGDAIAIEAHAEEMAPLAAMSELVKHKGFEVTPGMLCDGFDLGNSDAKEVSKAITVFGVTADWDNLAKVNPKYPKDYDASFETFVDRRTRPAKLGETSNLVMITTNVIFCRTSRQNIPGYAFSVAMDGRILAAARGNEVGNVYRWSDVDMSAEMQDIFSTELELWSSAAMRRHVEDLLNKR